MAKKSKHRRPRPLLPVSSARPTASWKSRTHRRSRGTEEMRAACSRRALEDKSALLSHTAKSSKKDDKPKKKRFQFFRDVKSEMRA